MSKLIATGILGFGLTLASVAFAQGAPVATITKVEGKVQVNQGDGFVPASEGMRLQAGDRVMVGDDSEADLKYDDECKRDVDENRIATVGDKSPCAGGVLAEQALEPEGQGAIGATTGATGTGNGGVAAMVAIVAAIDIWWLSEDDHDVVSP